METEVGINLRTGHNVKCRTHFARETASGEMICRAKILWFSQSNFLMCFFTLLFSYYFLMSIYERERETA